MKAIVIYDTKTGNTKKVARIIRDTLAEEKVDSTLTKVDDALEEHAWDIRVLSMRPGTDP